MPGLSVRDVVETLVQLHEAKDRSYKDAWRRRGELIGIFCNIARKYDRLELARHELDPDTVEPRTDTAADLCIYACKYVTWLIEHDPEAAAAIPGATSDRWSATRGHAAVALALKTLAAEQPAPPENLAAAFAAIEHPFTELEQILVERREVSVQAKATLAWALAAASLGYLCRLALDEDAGWKRFTTYVNSLA